MGGSAITSRLTGTGVWSAALRYGDAAEGADAAAELESLGYTAAWVPDIGGDVFGSVERLMAATSTMTIATGILNLWMHEPEETGAEHARLVAAHGPRFLVGIGVSHAPLIDMAEPGRYQQPLARMRAYLDGLDAAPQPLAPADRVLAALGPRMLQLARDRTAGAHPYLANPDHTAMARSELGAEPLLAPEQPIVLDSDPSTARATARAHLAGYLALPNYRNNLLRIGFSEGDVSDGGTDRLVDGVVAWGDSGAIARRVQAHRDAGADHVCIQVLGVDPRQFPRQQWRDLAAAVC
jgi:probable F420-dependent oxidoreductase